MLIFRANHLQDCVFDKKRDDTALRVVYQGNFYLNCNNCCKRWFITFNGAECSGPMPIDVVWWMLNINQQSHKPGAIEGYCDNIHKGKIRVGINIGNCAGHGNSNGHTGWGSVSRLMIEEVSRSQWSVDGSWSFIRITETTAMNWGLI